MDVVAKEFRIAEDVSGFRIVVGVPKRQRQRREDQRCGFKIRPLGRRAMQKRPRHFPSEQRCRNQNRGFFRQCREGEPNCGGQSAFANVGEQSPEDERRGSKIDVGHRALREEHGIDRGACGGGDGDFCIRDTLRQAKDS